jgi:dTDP-4-amino-4,6-dideoxygalactose transaminase
MIAFNYREKLKDSMQFFVPPEFDGGHVYHLFPVLTTHRAALQAHLTSRSIETLIHYPTPITRQAAMAGWNPAPCPVADRVCGELLSLPMYPGLSDDEVGMVIDAARSFSV